MMIVDSDLGAIIRQAQAEPHYRTVIMSDARTGIYLAAKFDHGYDEHASPEAVHQLFDSSYQTLVTASHQIFHAQSLPIVQFLGRYKVTKITKAGDGRIAISDATSAPVDNYVGME